MAMWRYWLWDHAAVVAFIWINSKWHERVVVEPATPGTGCTRLCHILDVMVERLYLPGPEKPTSIDAWDGIS